MRTADCFQLLARRWQSELVVCTLGSVTSEWHKITKDDQAFHMHAMGIAASFALGLALSRPKTPIWLLDSDGGLSMSLGCLLAEARHKPVNLIHFVVNNGSYQIIGGYPVVNADQTDYAGMAKAAGIKRTYRFKELSDFRDNLDQIITLREHGFVVLEVEAESAPKVAVPFEGPEIKYRFGRHVENQEGIAVFGPYGY
jgi:sulfopyruvate decarboxylase subunit beta